MSYDVSIGEDYFNYTSNLGRFFYDHIADEGKGGGLRELHGVTGKQGAEILSRAFQQISAGRNRIDEASYKAEYDAKNGWGTTFGALVFLADIMASCVQNPRKRITLSM